jgi:PhzF family phenazine biosynthesis protein
MKIKIFQIDAFTNKAFHGNPAAVCPLETWLDDKILQAIACENNLSETAFFIPINDDTYHLRWFTPLAEVKLCGHATLAAAHVIFNHLNFHKEIINFETLSGQLTVKKKSFPLCKGLEMAFPASMPEACYDIPSNLIRALNDIQPIEVMVAQDYMVIYENEEIIKNLRPNYELLSSLDRQGVIVTAKGSDRDFVSRFFVPKLGINEDPVTGSTHCQLVPYWANITHKKILTASQLSIRGGDLYCELQNNKVLITGEAITFMEGYITINNP